MFLLEVCTKIPEAENQRRTDNVQWPRDEIDKQMSTKRIRYAKDWATQAPLKPGVN